MTDTPDSHGGNPVPAPAPTVFPAPPPGRRWRLLIVEDHLLVRDGLIAVLQTVPVFEIVGVAAISREARALAAKLAPDLVLLDYYLGDSDDGATLVRALAEECPAARVLVLSLHREEEFGERALRAGARGYISKAAGGPELFRAIATVLRGELYVSERLRTLLLEQVVAPAGAARGSPRHVLTEREWQVYRLLGAGQSVAEISARLRLSAKTVSSHRETLKNKLSCHSARELADHATAWWRSHGGGG